LVNERFLLDPSASCRSTITDEQLYAGGKILSGLLINQLANDSEKKYEFF
jgi:hypothetical protein